MVRTSLSTTLLPRAGVLTDALLAPPVSVVSGAELGELRRDMESELHLVGPALRGHRHIRIDGYRLRNTGQDRRDERPFKWSPWTARRPIALEAIRTRKSSPGLTPLEAVGRAMENLRAYRDGRSQSLGEWLSSLPSGATSLVQAEAVTLATQLVGALEWDRLQGAVIGGDRSIAFEAAPKVRLHARIDVRISLASNEEADVSSLFLAMTGRPTVTTPEELGLAALTVALHPRLGLPARVIGWWPQCGRAAIAEVDLGLLRRTAQAVIRSVGATRQDAAPMASVQGRTDARRPEPSIDVEEVRLAS
jgi:hypothetical protein